MEGPRLLWEDLAPSGARPPHIEAAAQLQVLRCHAAWRQGDVSVAFRLVASCCDATLSGVNKHSIRLATGGEHHGIRPITGEHSSRAKPQQAAHTKATLSRPGAGEVTEKPSGAAGRPTVTYPVASDQSPQLLGVPARAWKRHRPLATAKVLGPAAAEASTVVQVSLPSRWARILGRRVMEKRSLLKS